MIAVKEKYPKNIVPHSFPITMNLYRVKNGDTFESIARKYKMETWELIYENYKTRDPEEVNWYVRNYVGSTKTTSDGNNYVFSSTDNPGYISVPKDVMYELPLTYNRIEAPPLLKNVWAGIGKGHSGDLFVAGAHDLTGKIYNLGDDLPDVRNAVININGFKLGPGLGASIGAVLILAHGFTDAKEMTGESMGKDFDAAIGAKLGDFFKSLKFIGKAVDTIQKYKKLRYISETAIKNHNITEKGVYIFPIPLAGVGLHIWGGYKFSNTTIAWTGKGI